MSRTSRTPRMAVRLAALGTGLAVAVLPLAATVSSADTPAPSPTTTPKTCSTGTLPSSVVGKPTALKSGLPAGAWVWHDAKGYHLRVTHDSKSKLTFTGTIHSSGHIRDQRAKLERGDKVWRNRKHTTVAFRFHNYGYQDGVNFQVGCAKSVTITLRAAGKKLTTTQIHLGATEASPTSNPFTLQRS